MRKQKFYNSIEKEEHYTLTDEKGKYLTHFTKEQVPEDSSLTPSENIAILIYNWCVEYGADKTLKFIAGDSTVSNTGYKGRLFFFLEKYLGHRLFWIVCQLHTKELKLRWLQVRRMGRKALRMDLLGNLVICYL